MAYIGFKDGGIKFDFTEGEVFGLFMFAVIFCGMLAAVFGRP